MDYKKPAEVAQLMVNAGKDKLTLTTSDLLIRGALAGGFLGLATTLAITATVQTGYGIVGALIFPAGFAIIVLAGFELVTGAFAILPITALSGKLPIVKMVQKWCVIFLGNLIGSLIYAVLFWICSTNLGHTPDLPINLAIIKIAELKTIGYQSLGASGLAISFTKGILCNWMVTMGLVLSFVTSSASGKILASWLPIVIFFAQGFEHTVVNMFVIPAGILMGAKVSVADWWIYNLIPVTLGNLVGVILLTALPWYWTYYRTTSIKTG